MAGRWAGETFGSGTHHQHSKVGRVPRHAENGGFEVALMPGQVNKSDHFRAFLADFHPIEGAVLRLVHHIACNQSKFKCTAFVRLLTKPQPWRIECRNALIPPLHHSPSPSNPKMSFPTELVRPDSISCLCRKSFKRAVPRPLSKSPCVNTPNNVDLPASTFPTTATRISRKSVIFVQLE